jgi:SAM-dependent methyltransferase
MMDNKKNKKVKYIHDEISHNMTTPNIVVPLVMELISPKSVVDIGCGIGTWLRAFKNNGVKEILGLDGQWCNRDLLHKYIESHEFRCVDLEQPIHLEKKYDLVISLEVAEHLSEQAADIFIQSLVNAGNIILFSAAIPGQGGFNHINEQWPQYWADKFKNHGYKSYDIIRKNIWNYTEIERHYKQNIFLVAHNSVKIDYEESEILPLVHPDVFKYINKIVQGKRGISFYCPLLIKSIINKIK